MYMESGRVVEGARLACIEATLSWVRIPFSPPFYVFKIVLLIKFIKNYEKNITKN